MSTIPVISESFASGDLADVDLTAFKKNRYEYDPDFIRTNVAVYAENQSDPTQRRVSPVGSTAELDTSDLVAVIPANYPEWLGNPEFKRVHGTQFCYVGGAMANGISSAAMVIALAKAGMLGFFGSAGLSLTAVETAIGEIKSALGGSGLPWGVNLIHTPDDAIVEETLVNLYLKQGVRRISASAFMAITPSVVKYACTGLSKDNRGNIQRRNHVFAKISRPEVAKHFMSPPPEALLEQLHLSGQLTAEEASLARVLPLAEDITVEADSGGHTDRQALGAIFPVITMLRDQLSQKYHYGSRIRLGAAGGLGTPQAVASAFSLGADYVLTGTVNQTCLESGLHPESRKLLADAQVGDVVMTPSSDMFERGVQLQVLKRGTMYSARAAKLYDVYKQFNSLEEIPESLASMIQNTILQQSFDVAWQSTKDYWLQRNAEQARRAEIDPKHKMALVFRSYLGQSSRWAIRGEKNRLMDYQIWCGPTIAAFNQWIKGSYLEQADNRSVAQVALNLLEGAAYLKRIEQLKNCGVVISNIRERYYPMPLSYQSN